MNDSPKLTGENLPGFADLDDREKQVLGYMLEGKLPKEIAFIITCATRTAEQHRINILKKLGVDNEEELIARAKNSTN